MGAVAKNWHFELSKALRKSARIGGASVVWIMLRGNEQSSPSLWLANGQIAISAYSNNMVCRTRFKSVVCRRIARKSVGRF